MPRAIDRDLLDCLERANPYTEYRIEVAQPDVGQVLRRQDQFTQAPSLVSQTPANSLAASARGSLILAPSSVAVATFAGTAGSYDLNAADTPDVRYKGLSWTIDQAFARATLKSIVAKVQAVAIGGFFFDQTFECQIYQITRTPGVKVTNVGLPNYSATAFTEYNFAPLLTPAPTVKKTAADWGTNATQSLNFDLSNFGLVLENAARAGAPDQTGLLPQYLIVVRLSGQSLAGTGHYRWLTDTAASHSVANVGTFDRVFWARADESSQWTQQVFADVPNVIVNIEAYPATGQGIFLIDLGAVPSALSTGRIEFERSLPSGTAASLELSTAGAGGPWTAVKHGDVVATKQRTYHLRTTLTADASLHATPAIVAQGIEFRIPQDVSVEGVLDLPTREIDMPWPKASIPEGKLRVVRTGSRDYLDPATAIASTSPATRLEADVFLASRHPSITRDKLFRLERLTVASRTPSSTSEEFTLLSYASRLKRKIPQKVETINAVFKVISSTTVAGPATQIVVDAVLPSTSVGGNEYDGKSYYIRVRSTTAPNTPAGYLATIQGSTDTTKLDFVPPLPENLVAGDVIEVHSGIFQTQAVTWSDYDPADAWWEVLTNLLAIPPERIGLGSLPRGGRPPKVTDIAPGDAATQAKRKITGRLSEEIEGDKVLDILSAIMGGVTLEIDGQIVFVQIYPLVDASGAVTVPLPAPAAVFDARDFAAPPQMPPGIDRRATVLTTKYGVPATAAAPDSFPDKATSAVDGDALLFLSQPDLEDYGTADTPDEISAWLYNTSDSGLYLASAMGATVVRATSTGLRLFSLSMAEKHPRLVQGDVIVIVTDGYTDYDPSTATKIKGPVAIRGVLTRVGSEGRQLGMFVPGLRDNVQLLKGGNPGNLSGLGTIPDPPTLSASFDTAGQLIINSTGDFATSTQKIAWATGGAPSLATVRAQAPIAGRIVTGLATGSFYPAGTTVYVSALAYNANGVESTPLATISKVREGSGTSAPPKAIVTQLNTEVDDTVRNLRFTAVAGSGGGGANLTYDIGLKTGFAAETSIASGNGTTLPRDLSIARDPQYDGAGIFILTDTATGEVARHSFSVPAQREEVTKIGGVIKFKRTINFDDGNLAVAAEPGDVTGMTVHRNASLRRAVGTDNVNADTIAGNIGADLENIIVNGGGQAGALNAQAADWTYSNGASLVPTASSAKIGDRSLLFDTSGGAQDSSSYQDLPVSDQGVYELSGWIKTQNLIGAGLGSLINVNVVSGVTSFTILEKIGTDFDATQPDVGVPTSAGSVDWTFVKSVFRVNGSGTVRLFLQQGNSGTIQGITWFDGIKLRRVNRATTEGGARGFAALDANSRLVDATKTTQVAVAGMRSSQSTNPISASWTGSAYQINIAAHTLNVGGVAVSYASGAIAFGIAQSTTYYVYRDDPNFAGGSALYSVTTNVKDLTLNTGRYFVGIVTTGSGGGASTSSEGGGGKAQF